MSSSELSPLYWCPKITSQDGIAFLVDGYMDKNATLHSIHSTRISLKTQIKNNNNPLFTTIFLFVSYSFMKSSFYYYVEYHKDF